MDNMLVELAELTPALPWKEKPGFDQSLEHSTGWLRSMHIAYDANVAAMATRYAFPDTSEVALDLVSDWITWMFYWDDYFRVQFTESCDIARAQRCIKRLIALFDGGAPADGLERGLSDLLRRTDSAADDNLGLARQLRLDMREYIETPLRELINVAEGRTPGLLDFAATRRGSFGAQFFVRLVQFASIANLSISVADHPFVRSMECAVGDIICLENDIASYRVEENNGDLGSNIIVVLARFLECDRRDALDYAKVLLRRRVEEFIWTGRRLREEPPESVGYRPFCLFLQGVQDFVAGHRKFCIETSRYRVSAS